MNRRPVSANTERYHFGVFTLDMATRELMRDGALVEMTPKMFALLHLLLVQRHRVVPHEELISTVWSRAHLSGGVLPQMVRKLRLALDQPNQKVSWIKGVRGIGYRFAGRVTEDGTGHDAPHAAEPAAPTQPARPDGAVAMDQLLYERARAQVRSDDLEGLARTVAELRSPGQGAGTRRCLFWADIFDCHLQRLQGNSKTAWHHLRSAQLMLDGFEDLRMRSEFHSVRGLYFESFTTEAEALMEFENAWTQAAQLHDIPLMAGCAARLAFVFARLRNWPTFEQWGDRSLKLARETGSLATVLRHSAAAAFSWQEMGQHMASRNDMAEARLAWEKALRLNEAVLNEPARAEVSAHTRRVARARRLCLWAWLYPQRRTEALEELRACLAEPARPIPTVQLRQELASLYLAQGQAEDLAMAQEHCQLALDICAEHGLTEHRDTLLDLSARVATAKGDHLVASLRLRELLQWRQEQSARQASRVAAVTAVRLETEHMLSLVESEREKARLLAVENQVLRRRAALLEAVSEPDPLTGLARARQFERHLTVAWEAASARSLPQCVALLALDAPAGDAETGDHLRDAARQLLEVCRDGDLVACLQPYGLFGVVFQNVGLARALQVCERIRQMLLRDVPAQSVSIGLADVGPLPEAAAALGHVEQALQRARADGGNRVFCLMPVVTKT